MNNPSRLDYIWSLPSSLSHFQAQRLKNNLNESLSFQLRENQTILCSETRICVGEGEKVM